MFESAFSTASIGMAFISPNGKWLKVNRAVCDFLGYSEAELLSNDFQSLTYPEDLAPDLLMVKMTLRGDINNYRLEKRYFHKDGTVLWAILSVVLIRDEDGQPKFFISQLQDISELKRTQLSLGHTAKMVALGEMAAGIAHEINNPLAIITLNITAVKQLLKEAPLNSEMIALFTEKTSDTVKRITNIMNSLRKISRDSAASFQFTKLDDIIQDALNLCIETMKNHGITLEMDVEKDIELECRSVEITQVLVNLFNNSIYALDEHPEKVIRITAYSIDGNITITVSDTGPGVPLDIRDKIMDPFFTTKPQGAGSGLGLSISQNIIADHMGAFSIKESKTGAKFVIELPHEQLFSGRK
jgi:PAS domain S-box-containing protein